GWHRKSGRGFGPLVPVTTAASTCLGRIDAASRDSGNIGSFGNGRSYEYCISLRDLLMDLCITAILDRFRGGKWRPQDHHIQGFRLGWVAGILLQNASIELKVYTLTIAP